MKIEIRTFQFSKSSWIHSILQSYEKKIAGFVDCEVKLIKDNKSLLQGVGERDLVVLCDERGKDYSSQDFSKKMQQWTESGKSKMHFIIGGPFGADKDLQDRADESLKLSSFVMNQEVAMTVLLEQIFRAHTILNNHPYHNE